MSYPVFINWNREKLESLKQALEGKSNDEVFIFEDHVFLTSYARYLVQYLEGIL